MKAPLRDPYEANYYFINCVRACLLLEPLVDNAPNAGRIISLDGVNSMSIAYWGKRLGGISKQAVHQRLARLEISLELGRDVEKAYAAACAPANRKRIKKGRRTHGSARMSRALQV